MTERVYLDRAAAEAVRPGAFLWTAYPADQGQEGRARKVRVVRVRRPAFARTGTVLEVRAVPPAAEWVMRQFEPQAYGRVEIDAGFFWREA